MPAITLSADEVEPGVLPPVCIVCGGPAVVRVPVRFSWLAPVVWLSVLLGVPPGGSMTAEFPTCGRHRRHWAVRRTLILVGFAVAAAILVAPTVADPDAAGGPPLWALLGASAALALTTLTAATVRARGVRAVAIDHEGIALAGVAPGFVAAVEAGRAEYARQQREWLERHDRRAEQGR